MPSKKRTKEKTLLKYLAPAATLKNSLLKSIIWISKMELLKLSYLEIREKVHRVKLEVLWVSLSALTMIIPNLNAFTSVLPMAALMISFAEIIPHNTFLFLIFLGTNCVSNFQGNMNHMLILSLVSGQR